MKSTTFFKGLCMLIAVTFTSYAAWLFFKAVTIDDPQQLNSKMDNVLIAPLAVLLLSIIFFCFSVIEERNEQISKLRQKVLELENIMQGTSESLRKVSKELKEDLRSLLNVFIGISLIMCLAGCQKELEGDLSVNAVTDSNARTVRDTVSFSKDHRTDTIHFVNDDWALSAFFRDIEQIFPLYTDRIVYSIHHSAGVHPTRLGFLLDDWGYSAFLDVRDTTTIVTFNMPGKVPINGGINEPTHSIQTNIVATGPKGGWIRADLMDMRLYRSDSSSNPMPTRRLPVRGFTMVFE